MNAIIHDSEYGGTRIVGQVFRSETSYLRMDTWTDSKTSTRECIHAANIDDVSDLYRMYPTGYNPKCGWCWLGVGHTIDAHNMKVSES